MDDVAGGDGVSGVDFSDEKKAVTWLRKQSIEVRCAIASRSALRVCANTSLMKRKHVPPLTLAIFRATIVLTAGSAGNIASMRWLRSAADASSSFLATEAQEFGRSAVGTKGAAALSAALCAVEAVHTINKSALQSARSAAESVNYATQSAANGNSKSKAAPISKLARSAALETLSAASADSTHTNVARHLNPLWQENVTQENFLKQHHAFIKILAANRDIWGFWHDWYLAMWEGRFTDWKLAIEVAKIDDDVWEGGAEAVAAEIERIKRNRALIEETSDAASKEDAPQIALTTSSKENVVQNRDAIALSAATLVNQLDEFKERVRGLNHLEPEFRQELLDFIESLAAGLEALLANLPQERVLPSNDEEVAIARWLNEFYPLMKTKAKKYVSPDNVSEAALPVSFILGFTAIGTMIAGPAGGGVGALVGGLITGQVKPGKAADELIEQSIEKSE